MAALGCWQPPWSVGAWFTCFYLHTLRVMCLLSKKSCHCRVLNFAYVGNVETWYKTFAYYILPNKTRSKKKYD